MRALVILFLLLAPSLVDAQATAKRDARLLSSPSGRLLATFRAEAPVQPGPARGGVTQVTVQGYLHRSLVGAARDSFRISVNARSGAILRAAPSGDARPLALLQHGMGLHEVRRRGEWVEVRRTAWVRSADLERPRQAARPPAATPRAAAPAARRAEAGGVTTAPAGPEARPIAASAATDSAPGALEAESVAAARVAISEDMTPVRRADLSSAPAGATLGAVEPGTRVVPLARDGGWVRVRVEGWIPEDALTMADTTLRVSPSAADIRADPDGLRGSAIRWELQVLAFQTADGLRRDMRPDEPYLLARGPTGENALVYLALPPPLVANGRGIPALTTVVVTGRVRVGRSAPAGVPIIDVQSISRR